MFQPFQVSAFELDRPLSQLSTFGIGGPARFFIEIQKIEQMQSAISYCNEQKLPFFILGKGSNCLFDDRGFDGLVILNKIAFCHYDGPIVHVGAGYSFSLLGTQTARKGWGGLEFACGIPGSVGGAVYMNAGANGVETCQNLMEVHYVNEKGLLEIYPNSLKNREFDKEAPQNFCSERVTIAQRQGTSENENDEVKLTRSKTDSSSCLGIYSSDQMEFSYRFSTFQKLKGAIVSAKFLLHPSQEARQKQLGIIAYRTRTQPYSDQSAGCVFRNPNTHSAGALIQQSGLKGKRIGGAEVSMLHANFFINKQGATSKDVLELIAFVKQAVKEKTGVDLETEIRCIPFMVEGDVPR